MATNNNNDYNWVTFFSTKIKRGDFQMNHMDYHGINGDDEDDTTTARPDASTLLDKIKSVDRCILAYPTARGAVAFLHHTQIVDKRIVGILGNRRISPWLWPQDEIKSRTFSKADTRGNTVPKKRPIFEDFECLRTGSALNDVKPTGPEKDMSNIPIVRFVHPELFTLCFRGTEASSTLSPTTIAKNLILASDDMTENETKTIVEPFLVFLWGINMKLCQNIQTSIREEVHKLDKIDRKIKNEFNRFNVRFKFVDSRICK